MFSQISQLIAFTSVKKFVYSNKLSCRITPDAAEFLPQQPLGQRWASWRALKLIHLTLSSVTGFADSFTLHSVTVCIETKNCAADFNIMLTAVHHLPQMRFGSKKTPAASVLLIKRTSLCSRPLWSARMPVSLCTHTAVTFSGIIRESGLLIEIPSKIKRASQKSMSSVQRVARQLPKRASLVVELTCCYSLEYSHLAGRHEIQI